MGLKRWLMWGIICSIAVAIAAYFLDILDLFDIKVMIIAIVVLGFLLGTLIVSIFRRRPVR
jgi:hypothetical protein